MWPHPPVPVAGDGLLGGTLASQKYLQNRMLTFLTLNLSPAAPAVKTIIPAAAGVIVPQTAHVYQPALQVCRWSLSELLQLGLKMISVFISDPSAYAATPGISTGCWRLFRIAGDSSIRHCWHSSLCWTHCKHSRWERFDFLQMVSLNVGVIPANMGILTVF